MNLSRHEKTLELDKILELLAKQCPFRDAAERARNLTPQTDYNTVIGNMRQTVDAHMLTGRFGSPSFGAAANVTNMLRRAQAGGLLTMAELLSIGGTLRSVRALRTWRTNTQGVVSSLDSMFMSLVPNKFLEDRINECIISEDEMSDSASGELANIRRRIRSAQTKARDHLEKMVRSPSYQKYLQDSIITIRDGRFVVPVKAECRGEVPGLVHDTSSSGSTVFIEPMGAVQANNEIKVLLAKEQVEIDRILAALSDEAGSFADSIIASYEYLTDLAVIFAKASLAYSMNATEPIINNKGNIDIKKARHPLIDKETVVATDIRLGKDFDTLVITGPNTGGKTVTLKTLGLFTLMAMCGLMIPANDNSVVSVFENVLADIGDEQSIEQSLSTFSAHMTNIKQIISQAGEKSLILIDELGAGTDPVEGAALAVAILEKLRASGAVIAATTHYPELKSYAVNTAGVENGCCEFDVATLRPTYKLLIGVPGRSNAFAISERLGIPSDVVDHARVLVSAENQRLEETVARLEQSRQELESGQKELEQLKTEAKQAKKIADDMKARAKKDSENAVENARGEAKRIIEQARRQAQSTLDELEEIRKIKASQEFMNLAAKAKSELRGKIRELENAADPVTAKEKDNYKLPRALKVGDAVLIFDIDKKATVLKLPDNQGNVEVQAGIMKMRVPLSNLRLTEQPKVTVSSRGGTSRSIKQKIERSASMEIDVRGQNVEEAIMEVDRFIDHSVLMGITTITIIHGKGTGVLRAGIQQHLKRHPNVRSFRLGVFGEGENGVTICELK